MTRSKHKWTFPTRFRAGAYGWKSSRLACQRLREAVSEIKKITKNDPVLGAEGAVRLMEKLWPALEHIDAPNGALGSAVNKALDTLIPIIVKALANDKTRSKWLDRLWQAMVLITSGRSVTGGERSVVRRKSPGDGLMIWFPRCGPVGRIRIQDAISTVRRRVCPVCWQRVGIRSCLSFWNGICALSANKLKGAPNAGPLYAAPFYLVAALVPIQRVHRLVRNYNAPGRFCSGCGVIRLHIVLCIC